MKTALVAGATGLAMTIAVTLMMMTVASREATATPAYSTQTKKACAFCHVNPGGGLPLNKAGQKFQAKGHKL